MRSKRPALPSAGADTGRCADKAMQRRQAWATSAVGSPAPARRFLRGFLDAEAHQLAPAPTARSSAPPGRAVDAVQPVQPTPDKDPPDRQGQHPGPRLALPPAVPRWPARASGPRRRGLTRSDGAASAPDLLGRDFQRRGGRPEIGRGLQAGRTPAKGPVFLVTVEDPVLAAPARLRLSDRHPTAGPSTWPSPPGAATGPVIFWTLYAAPSLFIRITAH